MPKSESKKGGGSRLNRTEVVTLRLDPKLRYITDLAARSQRRTTSGFIEWAIEIALKEVGVFSKSSTDTASMADIKDDLWDVDKADRFLKLATGFPNLLNHYEQVVWKLARIQNPKIDKHYDEIEREDREQFFLLWDKFNQMAEDDEERLYEPGNFKKSN